MDLNFICSRSQVWAIALAALLIAPLSQARIFTNVDGKTIDAELHSIYQGTVVIKRIGDGKAFSIPLSEFSVKDQNYIKAEVKAGRLSMDEYTGFAQPTVVPVTKSEKHFNASRRIDHLLADHWQQKGVEPSPVVDDATFLRRAYLKIIGRIPTHAEAVHFLDDPNANKRSELIDKLLDSPGYVSHNFNLWADVLRVKTTGQQGARYGGVYYAPWVKDQIRENVPYDEFVRSLLTAEGYPWENPATAYYLRDFGMPLDNMSMTTQIFLGTQLQCAQCHDHPTDQWTQKDFFELASFTYGLKAGINVPRDTPELQAVFKELNKRARKENGGKNPGYQAASQASAGRELLMPLRWRVQHTDRELQLPHDYQYDDAYPNEVVDPHVLFGDIDPKYLKDSGSRVDGYANWMTSPDNERFTNVIANRMWKHAMGKGLIEPIDNLTAASEADSPELMAYLEELMKALDYDLKQFQRIVYNTEYFQRRAVIDDPDLADDYNLEGPVFQRMSSEQIWDSIATLMTPDIDNILIPSYRSGDRGIVYESGSPPGIIEHMTQWSSNDLIKYVEETTDVYKEQQATRKVWLEMRNDPKQKSSPEFKEARKVSNQANKVWRGMLNGNQFEDADKSGQDAMMGGMMMSMTMTGDSNKKQSKADEKWVKQIRRASELTSPSRNGHLLEVFGQSDRELIENSDNSANVLQALFLMNSPQTNYLLANRSAPVLEARLAETPEEKLETLYIGFLARKPTPEETAALVPHFEKDPEKARQRVIWAMLNTQQFLFIQ
ncbi:MAG: DUF1549 domain-containing protein [Verrucomicrobiota bacterium]